MVPPVVTCSAELASVTGNVTEVAAEIVIESTTALSSILPVPLVAVNRLPTFTPPVAACSVTELIPEYVPPIPLVPRVPPMVNPLAEAMVRTPAPVPKISLVPFNLRLDVFKRIVAPEMVFPVTAVPLTVIPPWAVTVTPPEAVILPRIPLLSCAVVVPPTVNIPDVAVRDTDVKLLEVVK
jgi:hypothetical protein